MIQEIELPKVIIQNQQDIDEFSEKYPSTVDSIMIMQNADISNLEGLAGLETVNSMAISSNPNLKSLKGLENLKTVSGELIIYDNPNLKNVDALSNLDFANKVTIKNNDPSAKQTESLIDLKNQFHLEAQAKSIDQNYEYNSKHKFGTITDFGVANYKFNKDNTESYFIKLKTDQVESVIWGVDLQRNLDENKLVKGDFVKIEHLGKQDVQVLVKDKEEGTQKYIDTERNSFDVNLFSKKQHQQIMNDKSSEMGGLTTQEKKDTYQSKEAPVETLDKQGEYKKTEKKESSSETSQDNQYKPKFGNTSMEDVPKDIQGVKLNEEQREDLQKGNAIFLKGMTLPSGTKTNGYVALQEDEKGNPELKYLYGNDKVVIDDKIGKHKLSKEEKKDLERGKVVGPIKISKEFSGFLQVDKNINRVVVRSHQEIGVPKEIGGYDLSAQDQNRLANHQEMLPRIFKGQHGYFMANVQLTPEKDGLVYSNVQGLTNQKAHDLIDQVNNRQYAPVNLSDIAEMTAKSSEKEQTVKIDKTNLSEKEIKHLTEIVDKNGAPKWTEDMIPTLRKNGLMEAEMKVKELNEKLKVNLDPKEKEKIKIDLQGAQKDLVDRAKSVLEGKELKPGKDQNEAPKQAKFDLLDKEIKNLKEYVTKNGDIDSKLKTEIVQIFKKIGLYDKHVESTSMFAKIQTDSTMSKDAKEILKAQYKTSKEDIVKSVDSVLKLENKKETKIEVEKKEEISKTSIFEKENKSNENEMVM
jgi:hypothetical protein